MLRVYFCGGAGSNIGKSVKDLSIDACFVDSSMSNLKKVDEQSIFLIPDMDGAGKLRSSTYHSFKNMAEDVLIKHKPSDQLNVVVSSLSGGSGSIISPLLVKELINQEKNVLVVGINSKHSLIELNNTLSTLKTFKGISQADKKPISLFYVENGSRGEADRTVLNFLSLGALLINKQTTEEFDTSDLSNFINYNRVTDNKPDVSIVEVALNDQSSVAEKNTVIVSTILVTKEAAAVPQGTIPEYLSTCLIVDQNYKNQDMRVNNILGKLALIIEDLEANIKELQDNKKVNKFKEVDVSNANDDGVVL